MPMSRCRLNSLEQGVLSELYEERALLGMSSCRSEEVNGRIFAGYGGISCKR
jgi:hypothetical protein